MILALRAEHLVLAVQVRSCSRLAPGLAIVLERTPAVPAVHGDPGADPAAVALRVWPADVVLGYAVDVGQARVLARLVDVADDAHVGAPAAFVEHVEGDPGIVAYVLEPLPAFVHVHQHPAVVPQVPGGRGYWLAVGPQGGDDRRIGLVQHGHCGLGKRWFRHAASTVSYRDAFSWHAARPALHTPRAVLGK